MPWGPAMTTGRYWSCTGPERGGGQLLGPGPGSGPHSVTGAGVWHDVMSLEHRSIARGCSSMVEPQSSKLTTRVRFPSSAPRRKPRSADRQPPTWYQLQATDTGRLTIPQRRHAQRHEAGRRPARDRLVRHPSGDHTRVLPAYSLDPFDGSTVSSSCGTLRNARPPNLLSSWRTAVQSLKPGLSCLMSRTAASCSARPTRSPPSRGRLCA